MTTKFNLQYCPPQPSKHGNGIFALIMNRMFGTMCRVYLPCLFYGGDSIAPRLQVPLMTLTKQRILKLKTLTSSSLQLQIVCV